MFGGRGSTTVRSQNTCHSSLTSWVQSPEEGEKGGSSRDQRRNVTLDGPGTEQGITSVSQPSLDVFCRAFQRSDACQRPIPRDPSPLILRQEEETYREEREKSTASICPELWLWHKELKVIWQARWEKATVCSPLATSSPSRETELCSQHHRKMRN